MILGDLTDHEARARLAGPGLGLAVGPYNVRIRSHAERFLSEFVDLYRSHTIVADVAFVDFSLELRIGRTAASFGRRIAMLLYDGWPAFDPLPADQAMPLFEWGLNWCVAETAHRFLVFHASIAEKAGRAILVPGESGSGKSTFIAALCARGWRLFSDELALIDSGSGLAHAIPRPISLKNQSIQAIREFASDWHIGCVVTESRKGTLALLSPPEEAVRLQRQPAPVAWIVMPRYSLDGPEGILPLSPGRAFVALEAASFNYGLRLRQDFETVADLVTAAPAFEVHYRDLEDAVSMVEEEIAETQRIRSP